MLLLNYKLTCIRISAAFFNVCRIEETHTEQLSPFGHNTASKGLPSTKTQQTTKTNPYDSVNMFISPKCATYGTNNFLN